jgi:hypothetical protein
MYQVDILKKCSKHKTHIKPILQYGNETLLTVTPLNSNKIEKVQNKAVMLITGRDKSTPIAAMQ